MKLKPMKDRLFEVRVVIVCFKWEIERCGHEIMRIAKLLAPSKPSMHSKRQVAFVSITRETSPELMDRLRSALDVGAVENSWCLTPGRDAVSLLPLDAFADHIKTAWEEVGKRNNPQNVRRPKAGDIFVKRGIKDADRSAAIKMGIKFPRPRQGA